MPQRKLWDKVTVESTGCWHIAKKPGIDGYTRMVVGGQQLYAHRYYYTLHKGAVPDGLTLDHLCRNRRCVNPDHLEPVTQRENTLRSPIARAALNAVKTHCSRHGHPLSGDNLIVLPNGARTCRECQRESGREYQRRTGKSREWQKANRDRVNERKRARRAAKRQADAGVIVERPAR